jgi:hypothetical protein
VASTSPPSFDEINPNTIVFGWISVLTAMGLFIPTLAVLVRRLHDRGRSGWFWFITWIPLVGGIWLFVELCCDGQLGENQYGSNPKLAPAATPSTQALAALRQSVSGAETHYCSDCGAEVLDSDQFCGKCGTTQETPSGQYKDRYVL